ncbi:MAG: U32 family peptidase [Actinomycetota bacterium]|nr:U32 family peptidase [Actinomycetota bacterium]
MSAPAGGWGQLVAAINAGADSVYLGYKKFGARAYAENFDMDQLKKAVNLAHNNNIKVYLTLNTLAKNDEIKEIINFLSTYTRICSDGIIIQDYGIYRLIRDLFKSIPVHASTQLNIHNIYSLKLFSRLGFKRTVLAREMTLSEINNITGKKLMETEIFGHGSQCYSYSGSCYFSSFIGGRSGNRGRCTQPCRMKYKLLKKDEDKCVYVIADGSYLLSKSDLCLLDLIPEIIKTGVDALKIEGRMKSPEYVGIVTKIYRKYIDLYYSDPLNYKVDESDIYRLTQIFSRELGPGYFKEMYPSDIISPKKSGSIGNFLGRVYGINNESSGNKKVKFIYIKSKWEINNGDILEIWTRSGNTRINVKDFELLGDKDKYHKYKIKFDGASRISEKDRVFKYFDIKINNEAKSLLEYDSDKMSTKTLPATVSQETGDEAIAENYLNKFLPGNNKKAAEKNKDKLTISACIYDYKYIGSAINNGADYVIYNDLKELVRDSGIESSIIKELKKYSNPKYDKIFIGTPHILYDSDFKSIEKNVLSLLEHGIKNYKISNPALLELFNEIGSKNNNTIGIYLGSDFNLFNTLSFVFFNDLINENNFLRGIELSPELNLEEISKIKSTAISLYKGKQKSGFSVFGHGYFRIMSSRYKMEFLNGNSTDSQLYIEDIKGYRFRIASDYNDNMMIFNSKNICMLFDLDKIKTSGINNIILDSKFYNKRDFERIIKIYREAIKILEKYGVEKYKLFTTKLENDSLFKNYSKGHLLRGVE